jgi:hypothetical protein
MKGMTVEQLRSTRPAPVSGCFTHFLNEPFYKIANYDAMPPFFMTIVSSSDVWNYLWSNGGITAGRINCDHAIFPYYTADKVSDSRTYTGPYTAIKVLNEGETLFWEPFSEAANGLWKVERNIYKNATGSKVYFEEINRDLDLAFQYGWSSSDAFGLVRHSRVLNLRDGARQLSVLDGCRNILPACISAELQNANSVLLDAYKKTDLDEKAGIAIFSVSSIVTDKAEPSEGLFANVAWFSCEGDLHLSPDTPEAFRFGEPLPAEPVVKGIRPAFFVHRELALSGNGSLAEWYQAFDTGLDLTAIKRLATRLADRAGIAKELAADVESGIRQLESYIAAADGLQDTADEATCVHHEANVMFNIMRGGIFADGDRISKADFLAFAQGRNKALAPLVKKATDALADTVPYGELKKAIYATGNPQAERMFLEYLPLTFSRRHGDPSRPWNRFSIELKNPDGSRKLNYQGNWRDIFQNWEALALSYPVFLENMIAKFLDATTVDGFNPYRITREGIDWEVQEPDNPWSNIGYWGDHQVIYLAKLLELRNRFDRTGLLSGLDRGCFSSGNIPYRIKPYAEIVKDPRSTIIFDKKLHDAIERATIEKGTDAKLVQTASGEVALVSMTAKILQILGAKMANLVPGGGVWLNTQRPEWNDANNALAGYGLSMVTLYYVRRFLTFLIDLYRNAAIDEFSVPRETADFFLALKAQYRANDPSTLNDPHARRAFMDAIGGLFEAERASLYANGFSPETAKIPRAQVIDGLTTFLTHAEATIKANRRADGLYHAYNTMTIDPDGGMEIHYLPEMLEGQVAVLSSGILSGKEALELCRALKIGKLFRPDQYSYILYPDKELPHFEAKNNVSASEAKQIPLLVEMLSKKDPALIHADAEGVCHFNPAFRNARGIDETIEAIRKSGRYDPALVNSSERAIHVLYERTFNHQSFTGRSGTFYAYEGIGSIYWHMVSKLLLAVQEICLAERDPATRAALAAVYYDVRKGIGFNKTPAVYGAFPTDPYSHTPAGQGAKQPGMTGQVKEEVITRWGELGLVIENGTLSVRPDILRSEEFKADGTLSFTWCGARFRYEKASAGEEESITVKKASGTAKRAGSELTRDESLALFARSGDVKEVIARIHTGSALGQ